MPCYQEVMLDEFTKLIGYHRKLAGRLLVKAGAQGGGQGRQVLTGKNGWAEPKSLLSDANKWGFEAFQT